MDKERATEVKKGRQQFRGGRARRSNIVVVVVVVVPVDVDTVVLIGVQREPRDRAALFAQALTDPPPLERFYAVLTVEFNAEGYGAVSYAFRPWYRSIPTNKIPSQGVDKNCCSRHSPAHSLNLKEAATPPLIGTQRLWQFQRTFPTDATVGTALRCKEALAALSLPEVMTRLSDP